MDFFELNKMLGALLATCLVLMGLRITADTIFEPVEPAKPGFEIAVQPTAPATAGGTEQAAADEPLAKRFATATVERGQTAAKACAACHNFQKGGPNGQGPNLFGIVGRPRATAAGFAYSDGMKAKGGEWTYEDLDKFLKSPKDFVSGTKMNFPGFNKGAQRADVIAYLNSLADSPKPLPVAK